MFVYVLTYDIKLACKLNFKKVRIRSDLFIVYNLD